MRLKADPDERPAKTMKLDALAAFVPAIRTGVRAIRRDIDRAHRAFRPTDIELLQKDERALEALAHLLDIRGHR